MAHLDSLLQRCTTLANIKQLHSHLVTAGLFQCRASIRTKLVELCGVSPFGDLVHALSMFRSVLRPTTNDWNAAVRSLAAGAEPSAAIRFLSRMLELAPPRPDALTLSFALRAAARLSALETTISLHSALLRLGFQADVRLLTTLLDAYGKAGDLDKAHQVFDEMFIRDIATWNALLAGLAQGTRAHDAILLFRRLRDPSSPEEPNEVTVIAVLSACAQLGALREGGAVHDFARARNLDADVRVRNALIDMYAKCGAVNQALTVFHSIPNKTLVSFNSILMGLATHGHGREALGLFDEMLATTPVEPDHITYLAVLCGCVHAGLVDAGMRIFHSMRVPANVKHYGAVVDLLGRAGRVREAHNMVSTMPFSPDAVLYQTLLGACKTHGDIELAEQVSDTLFAMGSNSDGDYVLLSNVYAGKARWADVDRVRDAMRSNDVRKTPGFSYIEVDGVMHKFLNGDKGHERWREIYRALDEIGARISTLGYVAETSNILHDIGEEEKERALYHHSEKLAIAYGIISTQEGEEIRVIKNLRICGDCHAAAKLISKAYNRVIVVRDRARFHRFEGGDCTCGDYW